MREISKRKLTLACCTAMAFAFAACSDDGDSVGKQGETKCGDAVCTDNQECVNGECKDKGASEDPCDKCGADQICENGTCKDKEADPCDACTDGQKCVDKVCKDLCGSNVCNDNQKCVDSVCKNLCGSDVCADDKICDKDTQTCIDKAVDYDPCSECTETEECINQECKPKDPCANKTCPDQTRCDRDKGGECVDIDPCESVTCNDGQTCLKAKCIDDACLVDGAEKTCDTGKVCSKGECVDDGCQGKSCDEGWQCIKGLCEETACIDYFCEEGRTCKGGACVDNECLDMTCEEGMICSKGNCTYEICLDKDPCTVGKACNAEGNCAFITDPAISLDDPEDKTTDENGKTVSLPLHLNNAPTAEVRITCEIITESPNKEVDAACDEIVFNADNWQLEQTIILTGVNDYLKDGDQTYKLKVTTTSEDEDFKDLTTESVELTNIDMTKPGFQFSETALTTYEDSTQPPATFTIQLPSIPSADVSLALFSSNQNEGTVTPTNVTFTKENWNVPQTITVTGVDDDSRDGNVNYTIFFSPSESNDEDYQGISSSAIKVTNVDNDVAGMTVNIPAEGYEILEGQDYPLTVRLNTKPKKDVTVTLSTDIETEAKFKEDKVVLNAENWNTGVQVTLSGIADHIIDGDKDVKLTFTATSDDEDYNLAPLVFDGKVKDVDTADVIVNMGDSPIVKEGSSDFITMSLSLASKPTAKVKISLSVSDDTELKINKKEIELSPEYWDIPQDILVNSVDDEVVDGNIKSKVIMTMTSTDKNFNNLTKEIEFTTVDNDVAGFVINSNAASFPENSSSTTSMTIALLSQPTANVTVTVASTDASELAVTSAGTLTFTTSNWNKPQTVTAKVVDDSIADGTQTAAIKFTAASSDTNFNGITGQSALYTIIDDDAPSISLAVDPQTISQASPSSTVSVSLGVEPASDVTITLTSDINAITFSKSTMTFTKNNFNTPQTTTLNVNFGAIATASATANIKATASASNSYNGKTSNTVAVNLVKVALTQNFAYTGAVQNVTLPAGRFKFEVWGAQGGTQTSQIGGKGGYSVGTVNLNAPTTFYIYVGGVGENGKGVQSQVATGGFNGGGIGYWGSGGGGATHIASQTGLLSTLSSAKDKVYIVAGAGGGGGNNGEGGGHGGGLSGLKGLNTGSNAQDEGEGGTQTTGFAFGKGGDGGTYGFAAGGGAGWYGGFGGTSYSGNGVPNGGGGSGYLKQELTSPQTIPGNASMPAPAGGTETGHMGNGYARITLVQ